MKSLGGRPHGRPLSLVLGNSEPFAVCIVMSALILRDASATVITLAAPSNSGSSELRGSVRRCGSADFSPGCLRCSCGNRARGHGTNGRRPPVGRRYCCHRRRDRRQIILALVRSSERASDAAADDGDSSVAIIMFSENPRFPGIAFSFFFSCCNDRRI